MPKPAGFGQRPVLLSVLIASGIMLLAVAFFVRARAVMQEEIRARLLSTVAAAALHVDGDILENIRGPEDMERPEYRALAAYLRELTQLPDITFAYILRPGKVEETLEFVVDGDTAKTREELDLNGDGVIGINEQPALPGQEYDVQAISPLLGEAFITPTTDQEVEYDQWGASFSGYAPVHRANGDSVAVLGIDMRAEEYHTLLDSVFSPFILLLIFAGALFAAGLAAALAQGRNTVMLRKLNSERSGLLRLTFHQIGEPLTIMKWSLETLRDNLLSSGLQHVVEDHLVCMDEGLGRLNSIIDVLQLAEKVDLGTLSWMPVPSSLREVLDNAVGEWTSSLRKRIQTMVLEMPGDIVLPVDRSLLTLALRQILLNAIEYAPEKSVITVRVTERRRTVEIAVEDEGCGIPTAELPFMFEKYRRASNAHLTKPDGNGLGLFIAKGIAEKAGGSVRIESIQGRGTTVTIALPR